MLKMRYLFIYLFFEKLKTPDYVCYANCVTSDKRVKSVVEQENALFSHTWTNLVNYTHLHETLTHSFKTEYIMVKVSKICFSYFFHNVRAR